MLRHLLPALIPSWRFFDGVGPSPRIEYCLLTEEHAEPDWQPFRPPPNRIPLAQLLRGLLWNPDCNEALYLLSSSEKILQHDSQQAKNVIAARIAQAVRAGEIKISPSTQLFRFRLMVVEREANALVRQEYFVSPTFSLDQPWKPIP